MVKRICIITLVYLFVLGLGFWCGFLIFYSGEENIQYVEAEPEIIYDHEYVYIHMIETEIPKIDLEGSFGREDFSDWESLDELLYFLASDDTDSNPNIYNFDILDNPEAESWKTAETKLMYPIAHCADYSYTLRDNALRVGKYLTPTAMSYDMYHKFFGDEGICSVFISPGQGHMLCIARVGKDVYLVEPQLDSVVKYGYILSDIGD